MKSEMFVFVALTIAACAGFSAKPAAYEADMEVCLQRSRTCPEYVTCRAEIAKSYGRSFDGGCASDGGAE